MRFSIDTLVFEKFPSLIVGVIVVRNCHNEGTALAVQEQLRNEEQRIRQQLSAVTLSQQPRIDAWRKAYSLFGAKPKEHQSSVESLYRAVLNGRAVRHINAIVDCYNLISLKHMLPVGGEDLDKVQGNITLTIASADEPAVQLLGDKDARAPHKGEVIYKDSVSAICRRFNWREAERTKLTEQTRNAILVIEGISPATKEEVECALNELRKLVEVQCGGTVMSMVLDRAHAETDL